MAEVAAKEPIYNGDSVLPPEVLVPLLFALRSAYSSPALQAELGRVRNADLSHYYGTWRWGSGDDFVTIVKDGDGVRATGKLQDGRVWHCTLERHGTALEGPAKTREGFMVAHVQVAFLPDSDEEKQKRGKVRITFSSIGGQGVLSEFVATKARGKGAFSCNPSSWEYEKILSRVQLPIFTSFGVPGPPLGVWILLRSVAANESSREVVKVGDQCRRLLGQMESEHVAHDLLTRDDAADETWASKWLPPPPESSVAVGSSGLHGEGLVALRDFDMGEEILREEPLAVLHCTSMRQADLRRAALRLIGSGQVASVLQSSLWRGPPDGPKVRELAVLVDIVLDERHEQHRNSLLQALRAFAFNAFATRDDSAQALFACICKANHSCSPNASVIVPNTGPGQLVCVRPIARGEEVTVSYLNAREMCMERSERILRLRRGWEFTCGCASCAGDAHRRLADVAAQALEQVLGKSLTSPLVR